MNLSNTTAAEFNPFNPFDPSVFTSLDVDTTGFQVNVEASDGTSVTASAWRPGVGGKPLGVEDYRYSCARRLSGMRRVGPFAARAHEPSAAMLYVAQRAVSVYLAAVDAGLAEGCYRMILHPNFATKGLAAREWRIVPSFWSLSDAALAIMDGRVASGDVESSGPETDTVRALRETGRLIAFHTRASASDADEFLCRGDDDVVVVRGLAAVHEVLTAPPFAGKIGPINATWPIVGRETAPLCHPHGTTTTIIQATDAEIARGRVDLPDGSFALLSGHYMEGEGAKVGANDGTYTWADVNGHYVYV